VRLLGIAGLGLAIGAAACGQERASAPATPSAAPAGTRVYVSNEDGGDVAVIDPEAGRVVQRIPVGKRPRGLRLSHDGRLLYVALSGSPKAGPGVDESKLPPADRAADGVGVVDLAAGRLARTYHSGQDPESFDLSPDGKTLYVSNEETSEITVLDLATGAILKRVAVGEEPEGVTIRPDGRFVYVTCEGENEVVAVDTGTFEVAARMPTGPRPRSITFTRDGGTAFVTSENGSSVSVLDAQKHRTAGEIRIESKAGKPMPPRPMGSVLSPDGRFVYVSNGRGESVAVIDAAGRKLARLIEDVGARPWGIGVSPDGRMLYTANGPGGDVSIVDVAAGSVVRRVPAGQAPWAIVVGAAVSAN
jgi:YVTN family beta-propeller protein